ncbi:MAG: Gmad2 immunoglobulin-like domain-containing protein [Bacillota bacterium]|nr:Gmad2 immunoglobulin-like domain-containing protein [Bacillota bacterium]
MAIRHVDEKAYPAYELGEWVRANRERLFWGFFTFGSTRYLMVSRGQSPNPGYGVRVTEIRQLAGDRIRVTVTWSDPEPGKMYAQVISYPFDLVALPAATVYELAFLGPGAPESPGRVEPNIVVTSPQPDANLSGRLHLQGKARAFEGVVHVYLEDGHDVLLEKTLTGAGAPDWMSLDQELPFAAPTNPSGMLMVYTVSPRDGSKQDVVMVPVRFRQ